MIRRYKLGRDVELHKRTLEPGCCRWSARTRDASRAPDRPAPSTTTCAREIGGHAVVLVATDVGVDVFCAAEAPSAVARRARGRGAVPVDRGRRRDRARRARPAALRRRPRRRRDPAGGRPQRARGLVHEGLLRRAGDGRAAVLPRQAEPPPARAAAVRAGRAPATRCGSASARSAASARVVVSPAHGPIALAIVRREAEPGDTLAVGDGGVTAEVVDAAVRSA